MDIYKEIFWDNDKQVFYFWDETDSVPIGYWNTKDEASLARERYCEWLHSDAYPHEEWGG